MEIQEISKKEEWEAFLRNCYPKTFLQSWNWGEFCISMNQKIWRLGIYDNELIGICQVVKVKAKRGTFLLVEHGPIVKSGDKLEIMSSLLPYLKKVAYQEQAAFIRICPIWLKSDENIFKDLGFRKSPIHVHPEIGWVLDIDKPEEDLLSEMRKTTRYLIRQAQKNPDVKIIKRNDIDSLKTFFDLYVATGKRHDFAIFSLKFIENEFKAFAQDNQMMTLIGEYQRKPISSAIIVYWQDFGFYHQGASLVHKIPVSYLLQWEAIKEAKSRGAKYYSFWGIAPDDKPKHPWRGLTLFKQGFGGRKEEYIPAQDFVLKSKYWITFLIETIRKIKRGFA